MDKKQELLNFFEKNRKKIILKFNFLKLKKDQSKKYLVIDGDNEICVYKLTKSNIWKDKQCTFKPKKIRNMTIEDLEIYKKYFFNN